MKAVMMLAATALAALFIGSTAWADTIDLPPGSVATVLGHKADIALSNNVRGTFNCSCSAGKGSCTIDPSAGSLTCNAGTGGKCSGSCRFDAGTPGFRGAIAAARAHAASASHVPPSAQ
jgi:hypothetical protein